MAQNDIAVVPILLVINQQLKSDDATVISVEGHDRFSCDLFWGVIQKQWNLPRR